MPVGYLLRLNLPVLSECRPLPDGVLKQDCSHQGGIGWLEIADVGIDFVVICFTPANDQQGPLWIS